MFRSKIWRFKKSERGAAMVEFAIAIPVLLLLVFGIIEFSWVFNGWITLTAAAREGARLAIVNEPPAKIRQAVITHARTFDLEPGDINIEWAESRGKATIITVNGDLPLLTGILPLANPYSISASASMRHE